MVTSKGRKLVVCCRVYEQLIREEHKRIQKEEGKGNLIELFGGGRYEC